MAEFSKQWCELHDPNGIRPDFDILEVASGLAPEHYTPIICEGFGFVAIAKDENDNILLGMPTKEQSLVEEGTQVEWKKFNEVVK